MLQALTSSSIMARPEFWPAVSPQFVYGASAFSAKPCDRTSFAFDDAPSRRFEAGQGGIGASRFADSASRLYSLSPLSDDNTSAGAPPPGGSGSGGGGDPKDPKVKLTANFVFDALKSMRDRGGVGLGEMGLMDALLSHGIIKKVENADRDAMKQFYKTLDGVEEDYKRVEKAIEDRESEQALLVKSINSIPSRSLSFLIEKVSSLSSRLGEVGFLSPVFKKIAFLSSRLGKIGFLSPILKEISSIPSVFKRFQDRREARRRQLQDIEKELTKMRKDRKGLSAKVDRREVLGEWLGNLRRCSDRDCYVFLTMKGQLVLERMEGDRKLEYLTFEDYMKLFGSDAAA